MDSILLDYPLLQIVYQGMLYDYCCSLKNTFSAELYGTDDCIIYMMSVIFVMQI